MVASHRYLFQMRMLAIICGYLSREQPTTFLAVFADTIHLTSDAIKAMTKILDKPKKLTFSEMHRLLNLLNQCLEKRSVYSIPVQSMQPMPFLGVDMTKVCTSMAHLIFGSIIRVNKKKH